MVGLGLLPVMEMSRSGFYAAPNLMRPVELKNSNSDVLAGCLELICNE